MCQDGKSNSSWAMFKAIYWDRTRYQIFKIQVQQSRNRLWLDSLTCCKNEWWVKIFSIHKYPLKMPGDVSVGFFPVSRRILCIHNLYVFGYHGIDLFVQKCGIHWYTVYTETKMLSTSGEKRPRNRGSKCFELPFRPICECYLQKEWIPVRN